MKILHIISNLNIGGTEIMLYKFLEYSDKTKFSHRVIALNTGSEIGNKIIKTGIKVDYIKTNKFNFIFSIFKIRKIIKEFGPDIIQTYLIKANLLVRIILFFNQRIKLISSQRSTDGWRNFFHNFIDRITSFRVDLFLSNSEAGKNFLINKIKINEKKILVIKSGIDYQNYVITDFRTNKYFVALTRLHYEKGVDILVKLYKKLLEKEENLPDLIIAGEGPYRKELVKIITELKIENRVKLIGNIEKPDNLLKEAKLFFLTSRWEGLPFSILEAMSIKVPIVASDISGIRELIKDGETGILININDLNKAAEKIIKYLADSETLLNITEKAYKKIIKEFDIKKMVKQIEDVYTNM